MAYTCLYFTRNHEDERPIGRIQEPLYVVSKSSPDAGFKPSGDDENKVTEEPGKEGGDSSKDSESNDQKKEDNVNSTNNVNVASTNEVNVVGTKTSIKLPDYPNMPELEDIVYSDDDEDGDAETDINNLDAFMPVSHIPTTRVHKDHPVKQIIGDLNSTPKTRRMTKNLEEQGKIEEEVYICQPPGFEDPDFPERVYKVEKALYGLHQALRACQNKYMTEILKKFGFTNVKTTSTPMETQKLLLKDEDGEEVDVHLYRSMIGSLMYITSSRPDIMFVVCACARYQVNPKVSHLHAVKKKIRYLKGQPKLGLWYLKNSPFDLVAYTDSDYAGESLDRKSTTGGCQFLRSRLISWQCKKQTVVANSITEAEYVAASSYCRQVLWIQNQLLDYGYNFLHTKIFIDNEKNIEIRHHFIRDCNEKKLIQMVKIHTDKNVADLLTKAFDNGIEVNAGDSKLMLLGIKLTAAGETSIRRDLQLNDEEGTDCLTNATIFEELTTMGYEKLSQKLTFYKAFFSPQWKFLINTILQCLSAKTTAWNEFSRTMASGIICLATNQKFNFSKYIFESMVKNLDNSGKFLMYPRSRRLKRKYTEIPQSSGPTDNVADEATYEERDNSLVRAVTTASSFDDVWSKD
ncbi:putative ribonuclease H-like domain-containing protein [Tanacetum coccineum]